MKRGKMLFAALGALLCAAALALPASAATDPENDIEDALAIFTAPASNGYTMLVLASPNVDEPAPPGGQRKGLAFVYLLHGRSVLVYLVPARMTAEFIEGRPTITSLRINLGKTGRIAVQFTPSGGTQVARSRCEQHRLVYAAGSYEGTIEYHGEENFSDVAATGAAQDPQLLLDQLCREEIVNEVVGRRQPGARLEVDPSEEGGVELEVTKNHPHSRVHIRAEMVEGQGSSLVFRVVQMYAPAGAFSFDPGLRHARLSPGGPFAGSAIFDRGARPANQWRGHLVLDFPGRSDVPVTGPRREVTLQHAVRRVTGHGTSTDRAARLLRAIAR